MKGDHIFVNCGIYTHHAIDCGDDTVIHFSKATGEGVISRDSMSSFESISTDELVYTYEYKLCDPPSVVIQRAMSRLGKTGYDPTLNNCEHFATWCKTGLHESQQTNKAFEGVKDTFKAATLGAALATIPATTVAAPVLAIGALPAAAIFGGAVLAFKAITFNDD